MLKALRIWPHIRERILSGPLGPHVELYVSTLEHQGYSKFGIRRHIRGIDAFGTWLSRHGLPIQRIDEATVERYVAGLGRTPSSRSSRGRLPEIAFGARRFAQFLWAQGLADRGVDRPHPGAAGRLLHSFDEYLDQVKGLASGTRRIYLRYARRLVEQRFGTGAVAWSALRADDVVAFVRDQASRLKVSANQLPVTAVRALLRYLAFRGAVSSCLERAVPTIRQWKHASLPAFVCAEDVERVLACTRGPSVMQRRGYAILLLLARLGLRASEVAALQLEDIDWRHGQIRVHAGKSGRERCLPLPREIGETLVLYLRHARPRSRHRRLFLRARPPRGTLTAAAISALAKRAFERASVEVLHRGAHAFRHAAATQMVRRGASFKEIADVLGHARIETTAIYAKLDLATLARVALPWPGGES